MDKQTYLNHVWGFLRVFIASIILVVCAVPVSGGEQLLEGFENTRNIRVIPGAMTAVTTKAFVTQGKQAGRLKAGAEMLVSVPDVDLGPMQWLKIDTATAHPLPHKVLLRLRGHGRNFQANGFVQSGKDTLAMPLSMLKTQTGRVRPGRMTISLKNIGEAALIVDNLRIETAATAPAGALLVDFGPVNQAVWPGFQGASVENDHVRWSGRNRSYVAASMSHPDPLGGDYIGPGPASKVTDNLTIISREKSLAVWLWVTHYGQSSSQPPEYSLRVGGLALLHRRLTRRQMLGPMGLLEGMEGEWTPKWFNEQYARHFVKIVQFTSTADQRQIDTGNCQLAALAMAPLDDRDAMSKYVQQVQRDISRYRRQFILGYTHRIHCEAAPTAGERDSGAIIFNPPPDERFSALWIPTEDDRANKVQLTSANGQMVFACLAAVPVKESNSVIVSVSQFRTDNGRRLSFEKPGLKATFLTRIPRVRDAAVEFQPWVQAPKLGLVKAGQVDWLVVTGRVANTAMAGAYRGTLTMSYSGRRSRVPFEIEIFKLAETRIPRQMIGGLNTVTATGFYRSMASLLPRARADQLTNNVLKQLLASGLDAMTIPGVQVNLFGSVLANAYTGRLKSYPRQAAKGITLLDIRNPGRRLLPAAQNHPRLVRASERALQRTVELARRARLGRSYLYWYATTAVTAQDRSLGEQIVRSGGRGLIMARASRLSNQGVQAHLTPWSGLMLIPDSTRVSGIIADFKKLADQEHEKAAFIYSWRADRYLTGFYCAAVGADGNYVAGVPFAHGGPYSGFHVDGQGMLALQKDGSLAPTLALLRIKQGRDDYLLFTRCGAILDRAAKDAVANDELAAALKKIKDYTVSHAPPVFSTSLLRTSELPPSTMDAWRDELLRAASKVSAALKPRR